ncbi:TPA: prepilin peptidase-dependent protein [Klebsiella variicola]
MQTFFAYLAGKAIFRRRARANRRGILDAMNREHGYTLMETLVTLTLMMILSVGGLYGWQRVHAVGKHLQRAGYCRGACGGAGLELAADGECLIVRWDANSNGRWETSPAAAAESTGFRLRDGALETLRGASDCRGGGWEKITNPAAIVVTRFSVQRQVTSGFAPELSVTLAARSAQQRGLTSEVEQRVTGYNL